MIKMNKAAEQAQYGRAFTKANKPAPEKQDAAADKRSGTDEASARDMGQDAAMGVTPGGDMSMSKKCK